MGYHICVVEKEITLAAAFSIDWRDGEAREGNVTEMTRVWFQDKIQ